MSQLQGERRIAEPLRHLRAPVERPPDELAAPLDRADIEHASVLMIIDLVGKPHEKHLAVLRRCRRVRKGADRLHGPRQARVPEHERLHLLADRGRDLGALPLVGAPPVVAELPYEYAEWSRPAVTTSIGARTDARTLAVPTRCERNGRPEPR